MCETIENRLVQIADSEIETDKFLSKINDELGHPLKAGEERRRAAGLARATRHLRGQTEIPQLRPVLTVR